MTIVNAFSATELSKFGFRVVREASQPEHLSLRQAHLVKQNLFTLLENAKNINAEFVDFPDQTWILSKENQEYNLFGRISSSLVTLDSNTNAIILHKLLSDQPVEEQFVNTDLKAFVVCFGYLQSLIVAERCLSMIGDVDSEAMQIRENSTEEMCASLRDFIAKIDQKALAAKSFWDGILFELNEDFLPFFPQISFYFYNGRLADTSDKQ